MQAHSNYPAFSPIKPFLHLDLPHIKYSDSNDKAQNSCLELPSRAVWRQVVSNINGPSEIRRCMRRIYTEVPYPV